MHGTLHRPVYLQGKAMLECPIPMEQPPSPAPPSPTPERARSIQREPEEEEPHHQHLPFLICNLGNKIVIPHEATREVLSGRVPYYLVDETGVNLYEPKHVFNALKLDKERIRRYRDFPCLGAHQRVLEKVSKPRRRPLGLGYRSYRIDVPVCRGKYSNAPYIREPEPMSPPSGGLYGPWA